MGNRTYSSEFKLQVVLEALQSDGTDAEVARAYDVHPAGLSGWKTKLKENDSKAFGGSDELKGKKEKIAKLERMVGQKEVEIGLLVNFGRATFALSVVEAGGTFLVESADPFVDHRMCHIVQVGNLGSGVAAVAQKNQVSARGYTPDCLTLPCA